MPVSLMNKHRVVTISKRFLKGYIRSLDIRGTKEWPDISNSQKKDYFAIRGDWMNVGETIGREVRKYGRTAETNNKSKHGRGSVR